ncbi:ROK family transcriptional regulator [Streptomyces tsukubensis]|uniref:ROK family transcriptional regulator n=1 Tax=Streptomyces tsukubensis TaxID=83656 RepID=A0A1V3ZZE8_9ACTN|nr:ROK family transcriptional regulator [Streptomyces tsukubensis]OON71885.1 ROK family transcriptional regulator [Streptomyces tsukubensis]QFR91837.1 ROK family protein [Streptomyces tsukubensis]
MAGTPLGDPGSARHILKLVSSGLASSRADLVRELGLAPSTVSLRVQELVTAGLLTESGEGASRGGRRPRLLRVRARGGVTLAADLGSHHVRLGAVDLGGTVVEAVDHPFDLTEGPEHAVDWLCAQVAELAARRRRSGSEVRGLGVAFPGPVQVPEGRVLSPSRMPGWHRYPLREVLSDRLGLPVSVDNDATMMAVGEHHVARSGLEHLVVVKAGRGIGCGVISSGRPHSGATGSAGDISHVRVEAGRERPCSCGNIGCLETVASGAALLGELGRQGVEVADTAELLQRVADGDPRTTTLVRTAGRHIGEVLSVVVNFFNPQAVILGGVLATAEPLVAAVRGVLYERCLPLATADLEITTTVTGHNAGLLGAALTVLGQNPPTTPITLPSPARPAPEENALP